jgi:hypothetical protein
MIDIPLIKIGGISKEPATIFKDAFVDLNQPIKPQPIAISIGTHNYKGNDYPTAFASYGDFSCIVGASKSKKTFLKSLILSRYIGGNSDQFGFDIKGHDTKDKFVIDIDTEQSQFHSARSFRRVCEMVGGYPDFYKTFCLRQYSPNERYEFLEYLFMESELRDNLGLVSIDGVADLVHDTNDLEDSNRITNSLLKWSDKTKAHIITVLHRNFQSNKPTGHLGSSVLKKAETVLFVEKNGDLVNVNPEYTRNIPFDPFTFGVNKEWLPYVTDYIELKPEKNGTPF